MLHAKEPRPIHGKFLHITDIHPDPFYEVGTDVDEACHRKKGDDSTGTYGHPISQCDAPSSLVNATFDWIEKNLKDEIDFVIWTGDNVRHDRDNKFPRTEMHILDMNERMVSKFHDIFGQNDPLFPLTIPIIPSLGNNDVYPHNLFAMGPTLQTREFYRIWKNMVPEEQVHIFDRGACFMVEAIPGKLAVLSINTLYWFQSNPIVDGCDRRKDPGHLQFRWLSIILSELRARGMKVWLTGHVPPTTKNWEPTCLDRYSAWMHEFRDVVVGGLYGHMNVDHFLFLDSEAETPESKMKNEVSWDDESPISVKGKVEYLQDVRESYAALVDTIEGGINTRYSLAYVNPSVIPTYLPGLRVWEYNITGIENEPASVYSNGEPLRPWSDVFKEIEQEMDLLLEAEDYPEDDEEDNEIHQDETELSPNKKNKKDKKNKKKKKKADPTWPPKFSDIEAGPAFAPQTFSPTRYTQYFANLTAANVGDKNITYEKEYATEEAPYNMPNLLVSSWITLARELSSEISSPELAIERDQVHESELVFKGKDPKDKDPEDKLKKSRKAWKTYLKRAFVSSGFENLDD